MGFNSIPIVGTLGQQQQQQQQSQGYTKGEDQGLVWRDVGFAILYYIQLIIVIAVAAMYGGDVLESGEDGEAASDSEDWTGYATISVICGLAGIGVAAVLFFSMTKFASFLIKFALISNCVLFGLAMVISLLSGAIVGAIISAVFLAIMLCYARSAWPRIPFATANLVTAITAIRLNWGVVLASFVTLFVSFALLLTSLLAIGGVAKLNEVEECDDNGDCEIKHSGGGFYFLLLLSLFWMQQVMKNTIHVIVAGTVGTWWVEPEEASSCLSKGVIHSTIRATTYSFGSICYGSLLVAIIETLKAIAQSARENDEGNAILLCIVECILGCLQSILEYFNKWAFIYVGIYGYSYCEAGKNVFELFKARGWDAIIADDLVDMALFFVSLAVGLITGGIGALLFEATEDDWFENVTAEAYIFFIIGFFIGLFLSFILMNTISSAVNAVIVLFAEKPTEFDQNHNELSRQMREAWQQIYPGCF